jgi:hypothetical protein
MRTLNPWFLVLLFFLATGPGEAMLAALILMRPPAKRS